MKPSKIVNDESLGNRKNVRKEGAVINLGKKQEWRKVIRRKSIFRKEGVVNNGTGSHKCVGCNNGAKEKVSEDSEKVEKGEIMKDNDNMENRESDKVEN